MTRNESVINYRSKLGLAACRALKQMRKINCCTVEFLHSNIHSISGGNLQPNYVFNNKSYTWIQSDKHRQRQVITRQCFVLKAKVMKRYFIFSSSCRCLHVENIRQVGTFTSTNTHVTFPYICTSIYGSHDFVR